MGIETYQFRISTIEDLAQQIDKCPFTAQIAFLFGSKFLLSDEKLVNVILSRFPQIIICGCTTAGEILGSEVTDDSLAVTFAQFKKTSISIKSFHFNHTDESESAGRFLAESLIAPQLKHVFVLSEGLTINGSMLVKGLRDVLPKEVSFTGGLAGDGSNFYQTGVISNEGFSSNKIVAVGFYSQHLHVGFGSLGGWDPFGPERMITKSLGNILYELDGKPALSLYKEYLGNLAKDLPGSGLLFPLTIKVPGNPEPLVRTLLSINEQDNSLIFAGDVPQDCAARLMKSNRNRLLEGASNAATIASLGINSQKTELALLISCVGRRLVLKQLIEEEIEITREILGVSTPVTGFYSYGEIAPFSRGARCELHNQTMTITSFTEE